MSSSAIVFVKTIRKRSLVVNDIRQGYKEAESTNILSSKLEKKREKKTPPCIWIMFLPTTRGRIRRLEALNTPHSVHSFACRVRTFLNIVGKAEALAHLISSEGCACDSPLRRSICVWLVDTTSHWSHTMHMVKSPKSIA